MAGGLNTYAYANNSPLKYIDPLGLELTLGQATIVASAQAIGGALGSAATPIAGAVVGAAFGAAAAAYYGDSGDVANAILTGAIGGLAGGGFGYVIANMGGSALDRVVVAGIVAGGMGAIGVVADPIIASSNSPDPTPEKLKREICKQNPNWPECEDDCEEM